MKSLTQIFNKTNKNQSYQLPHFGDSNRESSGNNDNNTTSSIHPDESLGHWSLWDHDDELRDQSKKFQQQFFQKRKKDKKIRVALCIFALFGLTISQMSRTVLNVCIVEMVIPEEISSDSSGSCSTTTIELGTPDNGAPEYTTSEFTTPEYITSENSTTPENSIVENITSENSTSESSTSESSTSENSTSENSTSESSTSESSTSESSTSESSTTESSTSESGTTESSTTRENGAQEAYPKYDWKTGEQNLLLGAFYIGYVPFMMTGGFLAEKYGAKYVVLMSAAGSALINLMTPALAAYSYHLLVMSRILLGAMQAGIIPALYALYARWLTETEISIFAPMVKVALAMGSVVGITLPVLTIPTGLGWPSVFYLSGLTSLIWSILWYIFSNSTPQQSRFVNEPELNRIMRKKQPVNNGEIVLRVIKPEANIANQADQFSVSPVNKKKKERKISIQAITKDRAPWLLILTSPSVLSLMLVKFTYNFCLDFAAIEMPSYLKKVHHAPLEVITPIIVIFYLIQALFIVFVGMMAKNMVRNKTFAWSRTITRKVFQGSSNFTMALMYLLMSMNDCNVIVVAILLQVISFAWTLGAGGETMMPYDLSERYPATIMGIAHSIANISGVMITLTAYLILGDRGSDAARWNIVLQCVGGVSFLGGLVFLLVAKAKPIEGGSSASASSSDERNNIKKASVT